MTNNTRVEQTAEAGTRYIENEWQAKTQTVTSATKRRNINIK